MKMMTPTRKQLLVWGCFLFPILGQARVHQLYQQHCAVCHGAKGEGGLGGSLIDGVYQHQPDDDAWTKVIRNGLPDLGMQAFSDQLSEEQIRSLVVYLRELESNARRAPSPRNKAGVIQTQRMNFRMETILDHNREMWGVSFLPDGKLIVTEQQGPVRIIQSDGTVGAPVQHTPQVIARGQGGMLDIAVHPDYASNGWIYLSYSGGQGSQSITEVSRGRIRNNTWVDQELIYQADPKFRSGNGRHFGTRIVFQGEDVYFAIGDRGRQQEVQDLGRPNGKIHRLRQDGSMPEDNPFRAEGLPTIWSTGHRNPQALTLRPGTNEIWSTEHGPRGGDELNLIQRGKNYGWPKVTHGINYNGTPITEHTQLPGMESPVIHWTPSITLCGMAFVDGNVYPEWDGDLLVGGLVAQVIERLRIKDGKVVEREVILKNQGRVRDIKSSPEGILHVILEGKNRSKLVRLVPQ